MTSHERVMTALRMGQPDRVPIVEFLVDPRVREAIHPGARDAGDLADYLDLDNVGCGSVFKPVEQTADGWVDEWGVRYIAGPEAMAHPVQGPIQSISDLRTYEPPDPDAPHRLGMLPEFVDRYKGKRAIIFHHRAAFMWACYIAGIEDLLMAFADDPPFAAAVMEVVVQVNERIARNAVRAGADIVTLGDDYAANWGPMFSREDFAQLVLPRLQRVVDAVHEEGGLVIKHSDGNLWPILDLIVGTGVEAINPLEPVAGMDIAKVKAEYGDRVCLVGNIDCGELLSHGTVEQVVEEVRQCIAAAAPGGGYMLSSSNSIHSSVNPGNYVAMVRAGHKYGRYDVDVEARS
ncbi:MAG: uroporphyrinogen decarboxylase family protein [Phycisphaeraceae bacterium]|jgi:uroporphyrinogen decarboxylase|nr:uroporphyrinogen decarboxylase family protein [Phycisphaeraceae bacterium]